MKLTVVGTGYVGLVTGACLAEVGNDVLCLDLDAAKIATLEAGGIPIYEPGLEEMVQRNVAAGRLSFTTQVERAVAFGDVQFIAVGTPPDEDGSADLRHVLAAAKNIGQHMTGFKLVVDKSTVPVGTADKVRETIAQTLRERGAAHEFAVASNPEFLKEGAAVEDFMRPDRIVIGTDSERATQILRELYAPFQRNHERLVLMDIRSAELTKYAANAMLATRISFMNEMANLAEVLGADIEQVRKGIGADPRIGYHFLYAGCGYGGSCFPKDVRALRHTAQEGGVPLRVLEAVDTANAAQKQVLVSKVVARLGEDLAGKRFAMWGLAFKPGTDDMREAPSTEVLQALWARGASVVAHDPSAMAEARRIHGERPDLTLVDDPMKALDGVDALLVLTEWKVFRSPNFEAMKAAMRQPLVFDGRNLFDPAKMRGLGFEYFPIGRGGV
ncbi:UDP-glucose dehydrogenase family protein [Caenimonas aquaedulcis]|uniref:UDP-glucose 6-dehydrogenase n=1 Tax=Caenimonas aquaedulcis TaxID=2793270 RepID=A0A931H7E7_9BURK|nr:UDP-glucose/GDP-mannose dehydrogenase family protein [Caenimonas aquaedulcis]MBG9389797.1 UDP-glucose/GDP-mannose dehydrogenase family protein [Caenimonas aquaedulcis]